MKRNVVIAARQRVFLLLIAMLATPALGQDAAPVSAPARAQGTASTPDFFGVWSHPSFPWYEPPASGPGPVTNRSRWPYIVNQRPFSRRFSGITSEPGRAGGERL
jgi:hypothetical protein